MSTMASADTKTVPKKSPYSYLRKRNRNIYCNKFELEHGLFVEDLNPSTNEGHMQAYFCEWGTVTACKIRKNPDVAYVIFSTQDEADFANYFSPHNIGGTEVKVKRFATFKEDQDSDEDSEVRVTAVEGPPWPSLSHDCLLVVSG